MNLFNIKRAFRTARERNWDKMFVFIDLHDTICPACRRISDRYPAGYVEIKGPFFEEHRPEILNLVKNTEEREKNDRPLERIMATVAEKEYTLVTTTGIHLARRIGEALSRAYKGNLSFQYADSDAVIRVCWQR